MRRVVLALVCAGLLAAAYVPAAVSLTAVPVNGAMVGVEFVDDGVEKVTGAPTITPFGEVPFTVLSKRDMVLRMEVAGSSYVAGLHTNWFDYQLNVRTWHGAGQGTARIDPTAFPGGWFDCAINYVYVGGFPPSWNGLQVCHGRGTLDGVQLRLDVAHDSLSFETTFTGFVFVPGS